MIRSRKSYFYTPDGQEEVPLTSFGSILTDDYSLDWSSGAAQAAVFGTPWAVHHAQGGRACTLSFTQLLRFSTHAAAEIALSNREIHLHLHPDGVLRELYAYQNGVPGASRLWRCTVLDYVAQPLAADTSLGNAVEPGWRSLLDSLTPTGEDVQGHAWRSVDARLLITPIQS